MESKKPMKLVFTVVTRNNGRKVWIRVGAAFENRDGSWNVQLDAVPTNGQLQIREREERDLDRARKGFTPDDFRVPERVPSADAA